MEKYKLINITKNENNIPIYAEVIMDNDNSYTVDGIDSINEELIKFGLQEGIFPGLLLNDKTKVTFNVENVVNEVNDSEDVEVVNDSVDFTTKASIPNQNNATKEKPKKAKKKVVLTCVTVATIIALSSIPINLIKNSKYKQAKNNTPIIQQETYGNPVNSNYNSELNNLANNSDAVVIGLSDVVQNKGMTYDKYMDNLDNLAMISYGNVPEIRKFLNGEPLRGDVYRTSFQSMFDMNTVDYKVVESFNNMRNSILDASYKNKNASVTKAQIENFLISFIRFTYMGDVYTYSINNQSVDTAFNYLSPMAQNTIVDMALGVLAIGYEFSYTDNKVTYNLNNTVQYTNDLAIDLMTQLQNRSFSK